MIVCAIIRAGAFGSGVDGFAFNSRALAQTIAQGQYFSAALIASRSYSAVADVAEWQTQRT